MKAVASVRDAASGPASDPEALIREARRRQRQRRLVVVAGIAAAAGVLSAGLVVFGPGANRPGRPPRNIAASAPAVHRPAVPPMSRGIRATVLIWTYLHGTWLERPGSGRFRASAKPDLAVGDYQPALIRVGGWLVYVGDGPSAIRDDLSGRPRKLWTWLRGQPGTFRPAAQPGHVWLTFNDHRLKPQRPERARLVSVPAGHPGPAVTLPHGYLLVSGTDRGLLLTGTRGGLALWRPGSPPRPLPYSKNDGTTTGQGATARLIAYNTRCRWPAAARSYSEQCGVLRVYDVLTGQLVSASAPPSTAAWAPYDFNRVSSISPGNTMIAATAVPTSDAQDGWLFVARLHRAHLSLTRVPHESGLLLSCLAWSTHGSWLFYPGHGSRLWGYQATTGKVRSSRLPACPSNGIMAAYPSLPTAK